MLIVLKESFEDQTVIFPFKFLRNIKVLSMSSSAKSNAARIYKTKIEEN